MATITVKKPKKTTVTYGSGGSSSSSSSGRVPANSYGNGDKYVGGNTIKKADGTTETIKGEYTSPSGKVTHTDDEGNVKVSSSSNKSEVGTTYNADGTIDKDYEMIARDYGIMQMQALQDAQERQQEAIDAAYRASASELNNSVADAQRQAYVNQQKALKNLPQTMAAAGYTGGVTETNAANISNEYQNALTDLERAKAQELARLQANRANGIAESNAQYDIQMANMLQQAQQAQIAQQRWDEEMKLRQAAALLEQDKLKLARDQWEADQNNNPLVMSRVADSLSSAINAGATIGSLQPVVAYWEKQNMTDAQIADMLNHMTRDPKSQLYGMYR